MQCAAGYWQLATGMILLTIEPLPFNVWDNSRFFSQPVASH